MANVKLAVIYYSSTGTNHKMANLAADAGQAAGAETRVLKVPELAPEQAIASNPAWKAHHEATKDVRVATADDVLWADAVEDGSVSEASAAAIKHQAKRVVTVAKWLKAGQES